MSARPENLPDSFEAALDYIMAVENPTIDDMKLMVFIEAGGEAFYAGLANGAPNEEVASLLNKNGREERAHAHRVKRVIEKLSGESFDVPEPAQNPYFVEPEGIPVDAELLNSLIAGEECGDDMYAKWAKSMSDEECAGLFSQNGKEEIRHANRVKEALALLN